MGEVAPGSSFRQPRKTSSSRSRAQGEIDNTAGNISAVFVSQYGSFDAGYDLCVGRTSDAVAGHLAEVALWVAVVDDSAGAAFGIATGIGSRNRRALQGFEDRFISSFTGTPRRAFFAFQLDEIEAGKCIFDAVVATLCRGLSGFRG